MIKLAEFLYIGNVKCEVISRNGNLYTLKNKVEFEFLVHNENQNISTGYNNELGNKKISTKELKC